jgi:hypothetical protein
MKYILRWSLKNIERPKKKKQSTHLKRLKKHYFNPEISYYLVPAIF